MRIQHLSGTVYDLQKYNIRDGVEKLSAPSFSLYREQVGNKVLILGSQFESRTFEKEFLIQAVDYIDFKLLHNQMFVIFRSDESIYILDDVVNTGTRIKAQVTDINIKRINSNTSVMSVQFDLLSAYRESVTTTLTERTTDAEKWQVGQGLTLDDEYEYSFTGASPQVVYNAGHITVDSREHDCTLTITGPTNDLKIVNHKNETLFQLNKTTSADDVVKVTATRVTQNNISIFKDTNRGYIKLYPGENTLTVAGATSSTKFDWDFRFYYR